MRPLTEEVKGLSASCRFPQSELCQQPQRLCNIREGVQETRAVFEKLHKFLGKNIRHLVDRKDENYVFRLQRNRVQYVRESIMRRATNVSVARDASSKSEQALCSLWGGQRDAFSLSLSLGEQADNTAARLFLQVARDRLAHMGQCVGKFTHSNKFHLTIGCLDILSSHAKYKVCRPSCGLS